ncbi:hypothetical protein MUN82_06285 [Hymenobacter aerilatus]|uniref:Uncharacterized protein n=1 Tax=Hymenobacter aerilatus TaxID=2932251 RepID=A0A8T9SWV2_9BACT|nr:hypothetical protein [Hymenobacter aerilatus]UOR06702.1 hypothetical protein MUN82_06285 [Hymenobacter aerilatus]
MSLDKTATVIQHLVDERNKPGFDLLCKIFEVYPAVSKDWLMQGTGSMFATTVPAVEAAQFVAAPPVAATAPTPVEELPEPEPVAPAPVTPTPAPAPVAPEPVPEAPAPTPPTATLPPAPAPAVAPPAAVPATPAVAAASDASWQTALYTQQMAHQLAMAEMRNQHLQEQQRMMQQMMEMMQRQLS